ncbi:GNAT family N-acetyltransferase [Actinoalloteichus hymeniacidonis]|uniref:Acetyltransferase (GNAT) domain n=1 Tax=Actinoalloteichus hymeniacidonis TaxID=340345 RepID=A0AAC9HNY5_9PSEU|nr:GNAT family N-acetyltransferase [Actinoalloteichus hymeniacidonis]AOS62678.1 Acetyltransferase (GNAT) domain [Actinoalloteichus hymeniacidonis]MBB5909291.1 GNAT superfamily N-acetyltransferase [Actinoalloteichus hymeniacidonis]
MAHAAVRPALPDDAAEIARIQYDTWRAAYTRILPASVLDGLDVGAAEASWREAIDDEATLVSVAMEGSWTVGFCVVGEAPAAETADAAGTPAPDAAETGLIATLLVEPRWGRRGHGGRLLLAAGEQLRARGATRGITWVPIADAASLAFFKTAGWAPDGLSRTLDTGERTIRELRLTGGLDFHVVE